VLEFLAIQSGPTDPVGSQPADSPGHILLNERKSAHNVVLLASILLPGIVLRLAIDYALYREGYFFGKPWDTFMRAYLSWQWAKGPYLAPADAYWLPLQFWVVGLAYKFIAPLTELSNLWVPVAVNHLFFAGSLAITFLVSRRMGGIWAGVLAALLGVSLTGDIWATYSGLSEPISIFFFLAANSTFWAWTQATGPHKNRYLIIAALCTLCLSATHLNGWFLSLGLSFVMVAHQTRRYLPVFGTCQSTDHDTLLRPSTVLLVFGLVWIVPGMWLYLNWQKFGNPLHFVSLSAAYQAQYAGQKPILRRIAAPFWAMLTSAPFLVPTAAAAFALSLRAKVRFDPNYFVLGVIHFLIMAFTSLMSWTAPDQEPRYMVVYIWLVIPWIAAWVATLFQQKSWWIKPGGAVLASLMILGGSVLAFRYTNSFDASVRLAGEQVGNWLQDNPESQPVVIETLGYAEQYVIPMVAGNPYRFRHANGAEIIQELSPSTPDSMRAGLWVLATNETYQSIKDAVEVRSRIGQYKLAVPLQRDLSP
jgi:hypothetical protein